MSIPLILLAAASASPSDLNVRRRDAYVATLAASLYKADKNNDGVLGIAEVAEAAVTSLKVTQLSAEDQAKFRRAIEENFAVLDSNRDGRISLDEMLRIPLAHFDCLEANHDGLIPPAEADANIDRCEAAAGVRR